MNFTDFLTTADEALLPLLGSAAFRRISGGKWSRRPGDELNAIWVQTHSADPAFCVNIGVHYSFLEKAGSTERPSGDEIDQTECRIMFRLTANPSMRDQWWPLTEQAIREVCDLITIRALPMFHSYELSGSITTIGVIEIEAGAPGLLSGLTKAGACHLLASIHEHLGNREKCVEAAACGLKHVGMKVGPKKALKDMLKRCGRPA